MRKLFSWLSVSMIMLAACSQSAESQEKVTSSQAAVNSKKEISEQKEPEKETMIQISTAFGDMIVKLYNSTPSHRDNFVKLAKEGYYNDLLFHRVIDQFMIQGGDPDSKNATPEKQLGQGGPGYKIPAEIKPELYHKKGALAAARQPDQVNPQRASSGSQFYLVQGRKFSDQELNQMEVQMRSSFPASQREVYKSVGGTPFLDGSYTVFGEVVTGMEVIDKIAAVEKGRGDRPVEDILMQVKVLEDE